MPARAALRPSLALVLARWSMWAVWVAWASSFGLVSGAARAQATPAPGRGPLVRLTGPSSRDPREIGTSYLRDHAPAMGLVAGDLEELRVADRYVSRRTGTTHLYLLQQLGGVDVHGAEATLAVDRDGRLLPTGGPGRIAERLVRGLAGRVLTREPRLTAPEAIEVAARHLGITPDGVPQLLRTSGGPARAAVYTPVGISRDEIPAKLAYVVDSGEVRLCWSLVIRTPDGRHWWNLFVDAERAASASPGVVRQEDWTAHDAYLVYPLPQQSPDEGPRVLLAGPADPIASPFGWHDINGVPGADFTDTRGNNVYAQDDINANDSGSIRPDGGATLDFEPPLDLATQPGNYLEASVANLFYLNNVMHDVLYRYGFDEPAGNFQQNDYGNGGIGGDPVQADSQDGAAVDNAQFSSPPDGTDPRMEMFRWLQSPSPHLVVFTPAAVAGTYTASGALFGGGTSGLGGTLVQALDPADVNGPSTTDGCSPLTNAGAVAGHIALIDRGTCNFTVKVGNAQAAGALGVVIANNAGDTLVNMAGVDPSLTIPAIFIGQTDGASLAAELGSGVSVDLVSVADRDSSLDAGVVVHEYVHGLTNRLTAGPSNAGCLSDAQSAGMGEGWSDWFSLVMTALPGDQATDARGVGAYLIGEPPSGPGIRNAPYSTDLSVSPFTYADIASLDQPHGVGEVWTDALWEMYWRFVEVYGFDADVYTGSGGNERAMEVVVDALKLQPCNPTFVDGRDALLAADLDLNGGVDQCLIWDAFAKRGIGVGASDGGSATTVSVSEAFDEPPTCVPEPGVPAMLLPGLLLLRVLKRRRETREDGRPETAR